MRFFYHKKMANNSTSLLPFLHTWLFFVSDICKERKEMIVMKELMLLLFVGTLRHVYSQLKARHK